MESRGRWAMVAPAEKMTDMKTSFWAFLLGIAVVVGVAVAFATGNADNAVEETAETAFLGELDLAEQMEIWRNQYRRMTPGDGSLLQDVGTWPVAWEEFSPAWDGAPATRDLATWLVPIVAERSGTLTILRDANGNTLWSGATDFAKDASTNVTLTGALVSEEDWEAWQAVREEIERRQFEASRPVFPGGMRGTNGPYTNGLRFTNIWVDTNGDYRLDFAWETNGDVQVFCRAMHYVSWTNFGVVWTNDENEVITNDVVNWRQVEGECFNGTSDTWNLLGVATITNDTGSFTDTNHVPEYDRVRFYAMAVLVDTDGDGLTDGEEWLQSHSNAALCDTDNDGLSDFVERTVYHTDPNKYDTDEDGIGDAAEILRNLDPLDKDSDHDGLDDGAEDVWNTNPLNQDSDYDGMPDGWEVHNGLGPMDNGTTNLANGPDGDPDNDGFSNALEYQLGAPANNPAWNGNELAWKLTHFTSTVTTSGGVVTTNWQGLRIEVEDSADCTECGGTNGTTQNVATVFSVPAFLDCGYHVELVVTGSVEDVDANYDKVYFEAAATNLLFSSHNGIPDNQEEKCVMIGRSSTATHLVLPNSTVGLRYDTVGYKWHCGGYAEVISAVCVSTADVEIEGPDYMIVGDIAQMSVVGDVSSAYSWSVSGDAATIAPNGVVTAATPGVCIVTASNTSGCVVAKEVVVLSIGTIQVNEQDAVCNLVPNPKQTSTNRLFVATEETGEVEVEVCAAVEPVGHSQQVMCAVFGLNTHESANFDSDGLAVLTFTPGEDVETNLLGIGLDDDENGILDVAEFRLVSTNLFLTSFSGTHYSEKRSGLSFGAHNVPSGYELSSSLLIRFLDEGAPSLSFDTTSNVVINCFTQANLTHNAGALFDILGNGVVELNSWDETSMAGDRIAGSVELKSIVNTLLSNNMAEATGYLASHPDADTYAAQWTTNNVSVNFDKNEFDGVHEHDLHLAFGNALFPDVTVWVAVKRHLWGGFYISQLTVEGVLEDLYDFNYERAEPNNDAAVLQIGWDATMAGRNAGVIFFDKVHFFRTFNTWPSFNF